jgi:hypothetical protein
VVREPLQANLNQFLTVRIDDLDGAREAGIETLNGAQNL